MDGLDIVCGSTNETGNCRVPHPRQLSPTASSPDPGHDSGDVFLDQAWSVGQGLEGARPGEKNVSGRLPEPG